MAFESNKAYTPNKERKRLQRQQYHAANKKPASRSTPGRSKGIKATPLQRAACRRNRSHKWTNYTEVMASLGKRGGTGE